MSKQLGVIWGYLSHYKYLIVIVVGVLDPKAYQKIARENYFMKADDEDIFVLSTDLPNNNNEEDLENETVE